MIRQILADTTMLLAELHQVMSAAADRGDHGPAVDARRSKRRGLTIGDTIHIRIV